MGIRLIVEVLQHAPTTLTHREKLLLVVLAEDANDKTRTTWNSVESPEILRGAKLSRAELYAVLKKLIAKGVVKKVGSGQKNAVAKYALLDLGGGRCRDSPDTETAPQGQQNADTDPPQSQQNPDTEQPLSVGELQTRSESQCQQIPDLSVSNSQTPTPLPLKIPTTSGAPTMTPITAQTIVAEWLERVTKRPPSSVVGQVSRLVAQLLADRIEPDDIRRGMAAWMAKGLHPSTLPAVVNEVMNSAPPTPPRGPARYVDPAEKGIF